MTIVRAINIPSRCPWEVLLEFSFLRFPKQTVLEKMRNPPYRTWMATIELGASIDIATEDYED
jgi:hypothetical protein